MLTEPLEEIARSQEIMTKWLPLRDAHLAFVDKVKAKSQEMGRVVYVDLTSEIIDVVGKFVTYALFPKSLYSVMVSRGKSRCKISVGYNPWSGSERQHDISKSATLRRRRPRSRRRHRPPPQRLRTRQTNRPRNHRRAQQVTLPPKATGRHRTTAGERSNRQARDPKTHCQNAVAAKPPLERPRFRSYRATQQTLLALPRQAVLAADQREAGLREDCAQ